MRRTLAVARIASPRPLAAALPRRSPFAPASAAASPRSTRGLSSTPDAPTDDAAAAALQATAEKHGLTEQEAASLLAEAQALRPAELAGLRSLAQQDAGATAAAAPLRLEVTRRLQAEMDRLELEWAIVQEGDEMRREAEVEAQERRKKDSAVDFEQAAAARERAEAEETGEQAVVPRGTLEGLYIWCLERAVAGAAAGGGSGGGSRVGAELRQRLGALAAELPGSDGGAAAEAAQALLERRGAEWLEGEVDSEMLRDVAAELLLLPGAPLLGDDDIKYVQRHMLQTSKEDVDALLAQIDTVGVGGGKNRARGTNRQLAPPAEQPDDETEAAIWSEPAWAARHNLAFETVVERVANGSDDDIDVETAAEAELTMSEELGFDDLFNEDATKRFPHLNQLEAEELAQAGRTFAGGPNPLATREDMENFRTLPGTGGAGRLTIPWVDGTPPETIRNSEIRGEARPRIRTETQANCAFCGEEQMQDRRIGRKLLNSDGDVNFRDVELLQRYLGEFHKILPRRRSKLCMRHQRVISRAIKRSRIMGFLPFTASSRLDDA